MSTAARTVMAAQAPQRAPRSWHIEPAFGRFYAKNQHGGFSGWHLTGEAAEAQIAEYLAAYPGDSRDQDADQ